MPSHNFLSVRTSRVKHIKRKVDSVRGALTGIALEGRLEKLMVARVRRRFEQQRDPEGKPWRPVQKESRYGAGQNKDLGQALLNTKTLYNSIRVLRRDRDRSLLSAATGAGFRIGVNPNLVYGTDSKYAKQRAVKVAEVGRIHNFGLGVPKRTFMGVGKDDVRSVEQFLARRMKAKGLT
jgi:phage gpG-like protein